VTGRLQFQDGGEPSVWWELRGPREAAGVGDIEPAGSQRAVRSTPVPRDHRHFLSSLTWKLYGASHLWLRPFLASCLSSSVAGSSACSPTAPLSCRLLSASYQSQPEGTRRLSASLCLLLSLLLLLQDLSSFSSAPRGTGRAPPCRGHCGVPVPSRAWCRSWGRAALLGTAGSEGCARAGPAGRRSAPCSRPNRASTRPSLRPLPLR